MQCQMIPEVVADINTVKVRLIRDGTELLQFGLTRLPHSHVTTVGLCSAALWLGPKLPLERVLEWIEYHRLVGVTGAHLYDRENTLQPLVAALSPQMSVTRMNWPMFEPSVAKSRVYYDQQLAQDACLLRHRHEHRWLLYLDPDEYVHIPRVGFNRSLANYIATAERLEPGLAQLLLQNVLYAGTPDRGTKLLVEQFVDRADRSVPWRQKPLIHTASTNFLWAHFASRLHCGHSKMGDPATVRVNHYMSSSGRTLDDPKPSIRDLEAAQIAPTLQAQLNIYQRYIPRSENT